MKRHCDHPEPLAAILAEMRDFADHRAADAGGERPTIELLRSYADRIEAAAERERAVDEDTSDGYHTFRELYRYRMLYNAAFFNMIARHTNIPVVKSHRHGDGEPCFGGGWFIAMAQLPTGQVSNHYEDRFWELFRVPEAEKAPEWDGHTPNDAADRLESFLEMRETDSDESNPPGNAAAMREALKTVHFMLRRAVDEGGFCAEEFSNLAQQADAAISAPARNCDRFDNYLDARAEYDGNLGSEEWRFGAWLFVTAEGGAR